MWCTTKYNKKESFMMVCGSIVLRQSTIRKLDAKKCKFYIMFWMYLFGYSLLLTYHILLVTVWMGNFQCAIQLFRFALFIGWKNLVFSFIWLPLTSVNRNMGSYSMGEREQGYARANWVVVVAFNSLGILLGRQ